MARCWSPIRIRCEPARWNDFHDWYDVPCGKCPACLSRRRQEWVYRNEVELKHSTNCFFVTLTYADQFLPVGSNGMPTLRKRHFQLFMKRLRKSIEPHRIRFFGCGEYGDKTLRPHYHLLIYNWPEDKYLIDDYIYKSWPYSQCSDALCITRLHDTSAINYCCKYVLKSDDDIDRDEKPFMLCSRRPAIGSQDITNDRRRQTELENPRLTLYMEDGVHVPVPRYYRTKILEDATPCEEMYYTSSRKRQVKEYESRCLTARQDDVKRRIKRYGNSSVGLPTYDDKLAVYNRKKYNGKI